MCEKQSEPYSPLLSLEPGLSNAQWAMPLPTSSHKACHGKFLELWKVYERFFKTDFKFLMLIMLTSSQSSLLWEVFETVLIWYHCSIFHLIIWHGSISHFSILQCSILHFSISHCSIFHFLAYHIVAYYNLCYGYQYWL